jgi:hypothetical protein
MSESASEAAAVIAGSKQVASNRPEDWVWVDRSIWTERMLAALGNGVRGGKWFSLIDKVYRPATRPLGIPTVKDRIVQAVSTITATEGVCCWNDHAG